MKTQSFRTLLLTSATFMGVFAMSQPVAAQELIGANRGAATTINDEAAVTDNISPTNGEFGVADVNGGTFNILSVENGDNDGMQENTTIIVIDSDNAVADSLTVDGDVTIIQDSVTPANTDSITFELGASDDGASADLEGTGIIFDGNIVAGANGAVNIVTREATNLDTIVFRGTTTDLGSGEITLIKSDDAVTFNNGTQSFTGDINGATGAGEGEVYIINGSTTTFANNLGDGNGLTLVKIGDGIGSTGTAIFDGTVNGTTVFIDARDTGNLSAASGDFNDNVTATTLNLFAGDNENEDASGTFAGDVTATTTTLNETPGDGDVTMTFDGASAQVVAGTIDGAADNQGTLIIQNASGVQFTGAIGDIHDVLAVTVGDTSNAGVASFDDNISTTSLDVTASTTAGSSATFSGATVLLQDVELQDNSATERATLIFDGTVQQIITGTIDGDIAGDGVIRIINTDGGADGASFASDIGATNRVGDILIGENGSEGIANFNGNVTATSISIAPDANGDGSTVAFGGNVDSTNGILIDDSPSTAIVLFDGASSQSITGAIRANDDDEGFLSIENANGTGVTFNNDIGTENEALFRMDIGDNLGASAGIGVFEGNVFVREINILGDIGTSSADFNGNVTAAGTGITVSDGGQANTASANFAGDVNGTLNIDAQNAGGSANVVFDGDTTQSVGTINVTDSAGNTSITVSGTGTNVTFGGNIGGANQLEAFTIDAGNTATFSDGLAAINTITANSNITNNGALVINDTLTSTAGDTVELGGDVNSTLTLGSAFIDGTTVIDGGGATINATNAIALTPDVAFDTGTVTLIDNNGGGTATASQFTLSDTFFIDYEITDNVNDVLLTASVQGNDVIESNTTLNEKQTDTIQSAITNASSLPGTVQTALNDVLTFATPNTPTAGELAALEDASEQITSDTNTLGTGITEVGVGSIGASNDNVNIRLAAIRNEGTQFASNPDALGVAAGDGYTNGNFWLRGSYYGVDQDERDGVDGYEADGFTITAGADREITPELTVGLALSYGSSDVDGESAANSEADVDTYQASLYGQFKPDDTYLTTILGYGVNNADVQSDVLGLGRTSGEFDSNMYSASIEVGHQYHLSETSRLTPMVGFEYAHIEGDTYTLSSGAGSVEDTIEDKNIANFRLGASYEREYKTSGGTLYPEVHANFLYDLASDEAQTARNFGAVTFTDTAPDVAEETYNIGFGLAYETNSGMTEFSVGYDADFKEDYFGHQAQAQVKFKF